MQGGPGEGLMWTAGVHIRIHIHTGPAGVQIHTGPAWAEGHTSGRPELPLGSCEGVTMGSK